jgi:thymidylate synthase (FAD)
MARITVLDHGYIELVENWGSDEQIIRAARMSTGKGFLGWGPDYKCNGCGRVHSSPTYVRGGCLAVCNCGSRDIEAVAKDEKLLRFLYENKHWTPFEMAGMTVEVQAPIFVFREWMRHRTQSYNEMSARYSPLPDVNYIPTLERLMINAGTSNKQAGTIQDAKELTKENAQNFRDLIETSYSTAETVYQTALKMGVPKELARIHLPVGRYSRMMASTDLRNWLGFLTLRMASNAQYEIRVYAQAVHKILKQCFPRTVELFDGPTAL